LIKRSAKKAFLFAIPYSLNVHENIYVGGTLIKFSQCAKDVAAAFFDNPEAEVNAECTADLVPQFVLPDEPLLSGW
jgi:hypothetical protein